MNLYLEALKKYATFNGRAKRAEYWMFMLISFAVGLFLSIMDSIIGTYGSEFGVGILTSVYILATLIPTISLSIRRLHDINKKGWWILISLIPIFGSFILLFFMVKASVKKNNIYGGYICEHN